MSKLAKSSNYLLAVLFVLSISLIKVQTVHATCQFTTDPTHVPPDSNVDITLTNPGCFPNNPTKYTVLAYPLSLKSIDNAVTLGKFLFLGKNGDKQQNQDTDNMTTNLPLNGVVWVQKQFNNQDWVIVVCIVNSNAENDLKQCGQENKLVGNGRIYVGNNPLGTHPSDLPIIDLDAQETIGCSFQIGNKDNPITINKINNIVKKKNGDYEDYGWWRYNKDGDQTPLNRRTDPKTNEFIISEPPSGAPSAQARILDEEGLKKFQPGIWRICIDIKSQSTNRAQDTHFDNCLFVELSAGPVETDPDKKMSCKDIQTGSINCSKYPSRCSSAGGIPCGTDVNNPGFTTAIGCIHTNPVALVKDFLKFALGISGGIAFLLMILGAFQMLTSAGNPETLNAGKDRLTSALIGLLLIIFSVLLLRIIGVDILGLGQQFGLK